MIFLQDKYSTNKPQFKNWFYIYKNFSVEPEYRKHLQENYLTVVWDVDRLDTDTDAGESMKPDSMPEKIEIPDKAEDPMIPEKIEDPMMPEKSEDSRPEKSENSNTPEEMEDSVLPEKIEKPMISENTDDSKNLEKNEDSKTEGQMESEDSMPADKIPEKIESTDDKEETMQLSDVEAPSENKDTSESKEFPGYSIPSELRKLEEEKESKPNSAVITMQQEMLGESDHKEKIKDGEKPTLIDKIKEGFMDSIRDIIKDDTKEEDKTCEIKEDKNEEKIEMIKDKIKENHPKEEMTEDKKKKEDNAGVMMEEAMNLNPMSEEELIQEGIKDKQMSLEVMKEDEKTRVKRGVYSYLEKNDVSSSLSGNNLVAKSKSSFNTKIVQYIINQQSWMIFHLLGGEVISWSAGHDP